MMKLTVLLFLISLSNAFPAPPEGQSRNSRSLSALLGNFKNWNVATTAEYLQKFGYISKSRMNSAKLNDLVDISSFSKSIKEFQRMAGLNPSGKMDADTVQMMALPRCGVEDTVGAFMMGSSANIANSKFRNKSQRRNAMKMKRRRRKNRGRSRSKRYNLEGGKWSKNKLKYHFLNYTEDMSKRQVKDAIKRALNLWASHSRLRFSYTKDPNQADLKISFGKGAHGDSYPFDGKGGTLAHAFFPSDGRAHFDDSELFTQGSSKGINLYIVAAHEFGHSLGLAHSSVPQSLMAPFYQGYVPNYSLHQDDIAAIQQLYGKRTPDTNDRKKPPTPTTPINTPSKRKRPKKAMKICGKKVAFDTMNFNHKTGALYVFKGRYYWKIKDTGAVPGYPRKIHRYWQGLPGNINASVYSKVTKKTYFFKGGRVWIYHANRTLERGFPKSSSALGLPRNPQAAMQWGRDGLIYVFKSGYFYQFSEFQRYNGRNRYGKKKIKNFWEGLPSKVEAAVQWKNGKTFFFKGDSYWRYSGMGKELDKHYPRSFKKFWVGCNNKNSPYAQYAKKGKSKNKGGKEKRRNRNDHQQSSNNRRQNPPLSRLELRPRPRRQIV